MFEQPETIQEALIQWNSGSPVWSVEMGGLGPGYEQCIQIGVFEMLRRVIDDGWEEELKNTPKGQPISADAKDFLDDALHKVSREHHLGLSSAQAGAIKNLTMNFVWMGYDKALDSIPMDRKIQVSNAMKVEHGSEA